MFYNMFFIFIIFMVVFPKQGSAVKRIGHDEVYLGNDTDVDKTLRFNQQGLGIDPFIRYVNRDNKFVFISDGSSSLTTDFVDAGHRKPIIRTARCSQASGGHTCAIGNARTWWASIGEPPGTPPDGRSRIVFDSDVFDGLSTEFSCYTTAINASNAITCRVHGVTENHVDIQCLDAGANPANNEDSNFFILCLFHDN